MVYPAAGFSGWDFSLSHCPFRHITMILNVICKQKHLCSFFMSILSNKECFPGDPLLLMRSQTFVTIIWIIKSSKISRTLKKIEIFLIWKTRDSCERSPQLENDGNYSTENRGAKRGFQVNTFHLHSSTTQCPPPRLCRRIKITILVIPQDLGRYRHVENTEMNQVKLKDTETWCLIEELSEEILMPEKMFCPLPHRFYIQGFWDGCPPFW